MSGDEAGTTGAEAVVDPAALYAELTRPILVVVDAEVRELAEAWNQLMQLPGAAGENQADHVDAAVGLLRKARQLLQRGLECAS